MKRILFIYFIILLKSQLLKECNLKDKESKNKCLVDNYGENYFRAEYGKFKIKFKKKYDLEQDEFRYPIFKKNFKKILVHNLSDVSYKQNLNHFSDMTNEEFENGFLSQFSNSNEITKNNEQSENSKNEKLEKENQFENSNKENQTDDLKNKKENNEEKKNKIVLLKNQNNNTENKNYPKIQTLLNNKSFEKKYSLTNKNYENQNFFNKNYSKEINYPKKDEKLPIKEKMIVPIKRIFSFNRNNLNGKNKIKKSEYFLNGKNLNENKQNNYSLNRNNLYDYHLLKRNENDKSNFFSNEKKKENEIKKNNNISVKKDSLNSVKKERDYYYKYNLVTKKIEKTYFK